jgi:hypothetical protein
MAGNDAIILSSGGSISGETFASASIVVYSGGTSCAIGGNGVINQGRASDFFLYCAPTVTHLSLSGNGGFTGVVVAPGADLSFNAGGDNIVDFFGGAVAKSVLLNGNFHFHYDERLTGILTPPSVAQLSIAASKENIVLTWPTNAANFTLESTPSLASPVWMTNSVAPIIVNGQYTVTNAIGGIQQFFRLSK